AAGGTVIVDLFKDNHGVSDPALAKKLADEKLAAKCAELVAAGWAWAKPEDDIKDHYLYGAINKKPKLTPEEKARLKEIDKVIKAVDEGDQEDADSVDALREEHERIENEAEARSFSAKDMAASGCSLRIDRDGSLTITYGLTPPKGRSAPTSAPAPGR